MFVGCRRVRQRQVNPNADQPRAAYRHPVPSNHIGFTDSLRVTIRCQEHPETRVVLAERYVPDERGIGFCVYAQAVGLTARVHGVELWVWDPEPLSTFLDRLAADFRGWEGERAWTSNHLDVRATFHSRGRVSLTWTLRFRLTGGWKASLTTWLEAGEQMKTLAADVREFLATEKPEQVPSAAPDSGRGSTALVE